MRFHQVAFCVRLPRGFHAGADRLFKDPGAPRLIEAAPNSDAQVACREADLVPETLTLRLARVELDTGEIEVLITSVLDETAVPEAAFKALYHQRWGVEGDYRHLKSRLQLPNFTGLSPTVVEQDIHARILTKNLVLLLTQQAQACLDAATEPDVRPRRHRRKVNVTDALHLCKHVLAALLLGSRDLDGMDRLIEAITRHRHSHRPGREAPRRPNRPRARSRYPMAYRQTA
jgi:hypothetical protein